MAAGLSLREDVAVFRGKINACCELTEEDFIPKIRIDMAMPAAYPTIGLIRELARLEPFGNGNSKATVRGQGACASAGVCGGQEPECVEAVP